MPEYNILTFSNCRILSKLDFWFKSRLSEFQKRNLLVVNEAFEILSNEELGQKAGFSKDSCICRWYAKNRKDTIKIFILLKQNKEINHCYKTITIFLVENESLVVKL
ncbi:MAG: hypothetical protein AAF620_05940 [Bacteroidota bacterium]